MQYEAWGHRMGVTERAGHQLPRGHATAAEAGSGQNEPAGHGKSAGLAVGQSELSEHNPEHEEFGNANTAPKRPAAQGLQAEAPV